MNDIRMYVWLLPLLFILHDMEEVIFVAWWKKKEPFQKKYAFKKVTPFGTISNAESCAIAVSEELLLLTAVSFFSVLTGKYGVWFGAMVANTLHLLLIHIITSTMEYHGYVPGLVTAILTLVPCCYVIVMAQNILQYSVMEIIGYSLIGIGIALVNLKILHKNAYRFSNLGN